MAQINSRNGRWSIAMCGGSQDTVHFYHGNVTLHISLQDLHELGMAMQKMTEELKPGLVDPNDAKKKGLLR